MNVFQPARQTAARVARGVATVALVVAIAACSSSASTPPTASATPAENASAATSATAVPSIPTTTGKVSANTATSDELVAALTAAGIPNADRWAREVMEYRPYDTSDATLQRLQDNLAKYNPDPTTLTANLSALAP